MFKEQQSLLLCSVLWLLRTRPNLLRNSAADLQLRIFLRDLLAFVCEPNDIGLNIKKKKEARQDMTRQFFLLLMLIAYKMLCP